MSIEIHDAELHLRDKRIAELEEKLRVQTNYLQAIYSNADGDGPSVWQIWLIAKKALEIDHEQ